MVLQHRRTPELALDASPYHAGRYRGTEAGASVLIHNQGWQRYGVGLGLLVARVDAEADAPADAEAEADADALAAALGHALVLADAPGLELAASLAPALELGQADALADGEGSGVGDGKRFAGRPAKLSTNIRTKNPITISTHGRASSSLRGGNEPR